MAHAVLVVCEGHLTPGDWMLWNIVCWIWSQDSKATSQCGIGGTSVGALSSITYGHCSVVAIASFACGLLKRPTPVHSNEITEWILDLMALLSKCGGDFLLASWGECKRSPAQTGGSNEVLARNFKLFYATQYTHDFVDFSLTAQEIAECRTRSACCDGHAPKNLKPGKAIIITSPSLAIYKDRSRVYVDPFHLEDGRVVSLA